MCQKILGLDCNALYMYAIGQKMPHGCYSRLVEKNGVLVPMRRNPKYKSQYIWMDYVAYEQNITIKHKYNYNREVRIGPYLVDGYNPETKTIYEVSFIYFLINFSLNLYLL